MISHLTKVAEEFPGRSTEDFPEKNWVKLRWPKVSTLEFFWTSKWGFFGKGSWLKYELRGVQFLPHCFYKVLFTGFQTEPSTVWLNVGIHVEFRAVYVLFYLCFISLTPDVIFWSIWCPAKVRNNFSGLLTSCLRKLWHQKDKSSEKKSTKSWWNVTWRNNFTVKMHSLRLTFSHMQIWPSHKRQQCIPSIHF